MPELAASVGLRQYARHRGVDPSLVSRWKTAGRLALDASGQILVAESDALLAATMDPTKGGRGRTEAERVNERSARAAEPAKPTAAGRAYAVPAEHSKPKPAPAERQEPEQPRLTLAEATIAEKVAKTRKLEIEIAEQEGALVPVEAVRSEATRLAIETRQALMSIADDLADPLAAETDPVKCHALLVAEFKRLAGKVAEAMQGGEDA